MRFSSTLSSSHATCVLMAAVIPSVHSGCEERTLECSYTVRNRVWVPFLCVLPFYHGRLFTQPFLMTMDTFAFKQHFAWITLYIWVHIKASSLLESKHLLDHWTAYETHSFHQSDFWQWQEGKWQLTERAEMTVDRIRTSLATSWMPSTRKCLSACPLSPAWTPHVAALYDSRSCKPFSLQM